MARQKIYNIDNEQTVSDGRFVAALYIRLSREDGDKEISDSVIHQKRLLEDFVLENEDIIIGGCYIDDGKSGVTFDRPGFSRMLEDAKKKKINCIIVKDLSRLGRNYIETGEYLQTVFPFLNVRFISILDNIDSVKNPNSMSNMLIPIKNMKNDYYARDISVKIRSAIDEKRKNGQLVASYAPYGYAKDLKDKHKLAIDDNTAPIVKYIFDWYINGVGVIGIAKKLNALGIPSPGKYKAMIGVYKKNAEQKMQSIWKASVVRIILSNKVYTGCMEQKKRSKTSIRDRNVAKVPENERVLVDNTHEAIIDRKMFVLVQELFKRATYAQTGKGVRHIFSGYLRCADCNMSMVKNTYFKKGRYYTYFKCRTYHQMAHGKCTPHSIRSNVLEESLLKALQVHVRMILDVKRILKDIKNDGVYKKPVKLIEQNIKKKAKEMESKTLLIAKVFEKWQSNEITKADFITLKNIYNKQISELEKQIENLKAERKTVTDILEKKIEWLDTFAYHFGVSELTRDVVLMLIERIYVHEQK